MKMAQGLITIIAGILVIFPILSAIKYAMDAVQEYVTIFYADNVQVFVLVFSAMAIFSLVAIGVNAMGWGQSGDDLYDQF